MNYPIRHGLIENWNNMERLWQRCMFKYLRCEPEEHYVMLVRTAPRAACGFFFPLLQSPPLRRSRPLTRPRTAS